MSTTLSRWSRRSVVLTLVAALLGGIGTLGTAPPSTSQETSGASAVTVTKNVQRVFVEDGEEKVVDERRVTVRVNKTQQLRGRERLAVSWSGAHPSAARAANPYGELAMAQEYPVVLLQCRGVDDPSVPAARRVSPETCWTSSRAQRSQSSVERTAVWRSDLFADEADRAERSGMDPYPGPETCADASAALSTRLTPFRAADGKVYPACSAETMPPEAAVGAAFPPAEQAAFTDLDGNGSVSFEVRTSVENQSLGCSNRVDCTLVVIPIMGLSCVEGATECRKSGRFVAGSSNFANEGVDASVSPLYWWSASNWRNRISVPLTFGLPPDACDVLDTRAPTGFYGSELLSQAALQWSPAFCLRKDRFKFQHNRMADEAAFALMDKGDAVAALVSSEHEATSPVAYAPTAVTGFGIAFVADLPDNAGERTSLRLNARLLAKLLTQSYAGSSLGQQRPGMSRNPLSMNLDPEFIALNPGLDRIAREAMATLLSLSEASDVLGALTDYIASDRDAMAFVNGKPDRWGMVVNPSYRRIKLPVDEWPLLDTFIPKTQQECLMANPTPYFGSLAAPVTSLRKIAEAVLDSWPNVQTRCDRPSPDEPFKIGRIPRQGVGTRMMLGIVSLGDAARFGLRLASLETAPGRYVAPTQASLRATVELASKKGRGRPFEWTPAQVRKARTAYPGMQVVYTAARTRGMTKADAAKVAQFIRVSLSEGQQLGPGNGQLPDGYVPIQAKGVTAKLHAAALHVAGVVAAQSGGPRKPPRANPDGQDEPASAPTTPGSAPAVPVGEETPPDAPVAVPGLPESAGEEQVVLTAAVTSGVAGSLLPVLIALIALAAIVSAGLQVALRLPKRGRS